MDNAAVYEDVSIPKEPGNIRLLYLLPREHGDNIETCLRSEMLGNAQYEALSYTWGGTVNKCPIYVNDCEFGVTVNLEAALRRLRHETQCRTLWIDAICINQGDVEERNFQVNQMRDIYHQAENVVVWLGEEADDSVDAFDLVEAIPPNETPDQTVSRWMQRDDSSWKSLLPLFSRPYWERMWTVQEIVVASSVTVQCGGSILPWSRFEVIGDILEMFSQNLYFWNSTGTANERFNNHATTIKVLRQRQSVGQLLSILPLLSIHGRHRATDPRDKIFALLGLIQERERKELLADYSKEINIVFQELVKVQLEMYKRLDILTFCHLPKKQDELPSWTPDWSIESIESIDIPLGFHPGATSPYQADGNRKEAIAHFPDSLTTLVVKGISFDRVKLIGSESPAQYDQHRRRFMHLRRDELLQLRSRATAYGHDKEVLWRTIVANRTSNGQPAPRQFGQSFNIFMEQATPSAYWLTNRLTNEATTQAEDISPFMQAVQRAVRNRRPAISSKGFMGLVPVQAQVGDEICIILGVGVPFVLRQCGLYHQVIGEAYVHGIMDGEVIEEFDRGASLQLQNFSLR